MKVVVFQRGIAASMLAIGLCISSLAVQAVEVQPLSAAAEVVAQVSVNSASADELADMLIGVGPSKARAIVAYRDANGPFASVDELVNVKGIGLATIEKNRALLSL